MGLLSQPVYPHPTPFYTLTACVHISQFKLTRHTVQLEGGEGGGDSAFSSHHPPPPALSLQFLSVRLFILNFSSTPRVVVFIKCNKNFLFFFSYLLLFFFRFNVLLQPECVLDWNIVKLLKKEKKNGLQYFGRLKRPKNIYGQKGRVKWGGGASKSLKSASGHFAYTYLQLLGAYLGPVRPPPLSFFLPLPARLFLLFWRECGGNISGIRP